MKINRKLTITAIIAFISIFIVVSIIFIAGDRRNQPSISDDGQPSDEAKALLVVIDPSFTIVRGERTFDINSGETEVFVGDTIISDETGIGYVIFSDNSIISLDNNTEIEIVENTDQEESFNIKVKQLLGRTWSRVVNLSGKKADYQIETSNTIAVVRGTKFGCTVKQGVTTCSTYKGAITLNLKNITEIQNEIPLVAGVTFTNDDEQIAQIESYEELIQLVETFEEIDEEWFTFNDCLDLEMEKILKSEEEKVINYLIQHEDHRKCGYKEMPEEEEGEVEGVTDHVIDQDQIDIPAVIMNNVSIGVNSATKTVSCSWDVQNASHFDVATGTSTGSDDTSGWDRTNSTSYSFSDLALISGETYFCSVRGFNKSGYEQRSSIGVYYDQGSGSFNVGSFSPNNDGTYIQANGVSGSGSVSNTPISHLKVRFYFQNQAGQYFGPSSWTTGQYLYYSDLTDQGGGNFNFTKAITVDSSPTKVKIHYELYNIYSGNVLHIHTVQNVTCS